MNQENPYQSPGAAHQYPCPVCGEARGQLLSKCPNCGWTPDQPSKGSSKPKPQPLGKSLAVLLGLATALPLAYVFFFMVLILLMVLGGGEFAGGSFALLFVLHLTMIVLGWCLIGIYIWYLFKTEHVPADKKALWAVVLFLGNLLAMPIFWYIYVWKPIEQGESDHAAGLPR